jgi:hypothetical protein
MALTADVGGLAALLLLLLLLLVGVRGGVLLQYNLS